LDIFIYIYYGGYGRLRHAVSGCPQLVSSKLQEWGFTINPYDWCVANNMIHGKQCTVAWHVDDLKISHESPDVVTSIIDKLNKEFGKLAPLTVTRGKTHEYLGMTIDYSLKGKVQIRMNDYIKQMLDELPPDMDGITATPASEHLFKVNKENPNALDQNTSDMFHTNIAKLLFLCKCSRPDIQMAIAFLCTRVKGPDMDDYLKLRQVMCYLRWSLMLPLMLEANGMHVMKSWVDASFAVHDMRSQTGADISLGKGAIYNSSTHQKINTKSSTESKLISMNVALPQIIWTRYFLEAQGYGIKDLVIFQDN